MNGTNRADIKYSTVGFGAIWHAYKNVELQAYYEIIKNETSTNLLGFENDLKDNTFTLTLQFRY